MRASSGPNITSKMERIFPSLRELRLYSIRMLTFLSLIMVVISCIMRWTTALFVINVLKSVLLTVLKLSPLRRQGLLAMPPMDPPFVCMQPNLTLICQNVVSVVYVRLFVLPNV